MFSCESFPMTINSGSFSQQVAIGKFVQGLSTPQESHSSPNLAFWKHFLFQFHFWKHFFFGNILHGPFWFLGNASFPVSFFWKHFFLGTFFKTLSLPNLFFWKHFFSGFVFGTTSFQEHFLNTFHGPFWLFGNTSFTVSFFETPLLQFH